MHGHTKVKKKNSLNFAEDMSTYYSYSTHIIAFIAKFYTCYILLTLYAQN